MVVVVVEVEERHWQEAARSRGERAGLGTLSHRPSRHVTSCHVASRALTRTGTVTLIIGRSYKYTTFRYSSIYSFTQTPLPRYYEQPPVPLHYYCTELSSQLNGRPPGCSRIAMPDEYSPHTICVVSGNSFIYQSDSQHSR